VTGDTTLGRLAAGLQAQFYVTGNTWVTGAVSGGFVDMKSSGGSLTLQDGSSLVASTRALLSAYGDLGLSSVTAPLVDLISTTGKLTDTTLAETANVTSPGTMTVAVAGALGDTGLGDLEIDVRYWSGSTVGGAAYFQTVNRIDITNLTVQGSVNAEARGSVGLLGSRRAHHLRCNSESMRHHSTCYASGSLILIVFRVRGIFFLFVSRLNRFNRLSRFSRFSGFSGFSVFSVFSLIRLSVRFCVVVLVLGQRCTSS
jgi:hypothetical protein